MSGQIKQNKTIVSFQNDPINEFGKFIFNQIKKKINCIILKNNSELVNNINIFYLPNGVNTSFFKTINRKIKS